MKIDIFREGCNGIYAVDAREMRKAYAQGYLDGVEDSITGERYRRAVMVDAQPIHDERGRVEP